MDQYVPGKEASVVNGSSLSKSTQRSYNKAWTRFTKRERMRDRQSYKQNTLSVTIMDHIMDGKSEPLNYYTCIPVFNRISESH